MTRQHFHRPAAGRARKEVVAVIALLCIAILIVRLTMDFAHDAPIKVKLAHDDAESAAAQHFQDGEYYIDGRIPRAGVYSVTGRLIDVKQAIIAAGGLDKGLNDAFVTVIRRDGNTESVVMNNVRYGDLQSAKVSDIYLKPNDIVHVHDKPAATIPTTRIRS